MANKKQRGSPPETGGEERPMTAEEKRIAEWLRKLKFRKRLFGGVSEANVWRRIGELNELYERALIAERVRYDALIEEARREARERGEGNAHSE